MTLTEEFHSLDREEPDAELTSLTESVGAQLGQVLERAETAVALRDANAKLNTWVGELEGRNRETTLLNEMSDLLQSCESSEEVFTVAGDYGPRRSGATAGVCTFATPPATSSIRWRRGASARRRSSSCRRAIAGRSGAAARTWSGAITTAWCARTSRRASPRICSASRSSRKATCSGCSTYASRAATPRLAWTAACR